MGTSNYSDEFKRDAVQQITGAWVSGSGGFAASGGEFALALQVDEAVRGACSQGARRGPRSREPAAEAGAGSGDRGARHPKKEATAYFARQSSPMKYAFIRAHQAEFGVRAMCRVLRVHFSGFYAWLKEPLSQRAQEDARQTELIRQAWSDSGKVYGYRKLTDDLRDQGEQVSENRVARLAGLAGILAQIGYKRRPGRYGGKPAVVASNTLDRQFEVDAPDKVWVTDITYIKTHEGWLYLVGRHRSVLAARRRLVRAAPHDDRPGPAGLARGRLAAQTQGQGDDPFRPGIAVHQPRVAAVPRASTIWMPA